MTHREDHPEKEHIVEKPMGSAQPARDARRLVLLAAILTITASCGIGQAFAEPASASSPESTTTSASVVASSLSVKSRALDLYGRLPLSFEANHGQTNDEVQFLSRSDGYSLFLTGGDALMVFHRADHRRRAVTRGMRRDEASVLRMRLIGANANPKASGLDELPGRTHHFVGNDPTRWRTHVPAYAKVKYEGVYPGIDLVYYGNQGRLEYDLIVAPGADPRLITLAFQGADRVEQDDNGDLLISSAAGVLRQRK